MYKIIVYQKYHLKCKASTVPISPISAIKFVKKGTKVPHKRTPPVGILHQASGILHLDSKHFSIHLAFTQQRPDIAVFSSPLRKVMLIE